MRKSLVKFAPLALCACVGSAFADDTSITLYGTLDAALANVQHSFNFDGQFPVSINPTPNKATQSATGMLNGGMSATKWGLRGTEDIGGGMKAIFLLEQGFNLPSGATSNAAASVANNTSTTGPNVGVDSAISGQMFSRGAYAGVAGDWGQLTLGRNVSFFLDNIPTFDPMLASQAFSPLGFSGSYGGGGYTDDSRVDGSVKYKFTTGGLTLGALYKFGGVAGANTAQTAYQFNATYASGPFAVEAGYEQFKDALSLTNPSAANLGKVNVTAADTRAFMLAGKYSILSNLTVRAGYEREEFKNPSNPTNDAAITSVFGYTVAAVSTTAFPNTRDYNVYWLGGNYDVTSAFSILLGGYHVAQNSYNCTSPTAAGCSGATNYYSFAADYHFSKRTDTYLGFMKDRASGGMASGYATTSTGVQVPGNRTIALGIRHMF